MSLSELPARIRQAIEHKDLNIKQFSQKTGIPYSSLQSYLRGERTPGAEAIVAICTQLSIRADWLLLGEGEMERPIASVTSAGSTPLKAPLPELRSQANPTSGAWTSSIKAVSTQEELTELRATGLDRLLLLSRRGSQDGVWAVLRVLIEVGRPMPFSDIWQMLREEHPSLELADVASDCEIAVLLGLASVHHSGEITSYEAHPASRVVADQDLDALQAVREAIRGLATEIAPHCRPLNRRAWLGRGIITTHSPLELVRQVRDLADDLNQRFNSDSSDAAPVHIILAAACGPENTADRS